MPSRSVSFVLVSIFFLAACTPAGPGQATTPTGPEPTLVLHTYLATDAPILNPERGLFTPFELPGPAEFGPVRITGNTLVHLNIRLDDWRESDLPQDVVAILNTNFADIRAAGVKSIVRFSYNQGPYPDSEPDASKEQILRHLEQLTPLLQDNADIIAWLEAGFIGAWGEWHTSTNGLDNITDKRDILNAILTAIPNRYVQVRYPANLIELYPDPKDAANAYLAHHNDCFLSSNTDVGTYERDGTITIERDQAYLAELTRVTPMSGETCAPNPPRSDCPVALQEMALLHFSAINEAYHTGILRSWESGGCMVEITNRLGYRLALTRAEFNEQVRPGGILNLNLQLQNTGFASLINPRSVIVVLEPIVGAGLRPAPTRYELTLPINPRHWEAASTPTVSIRLRVPSNAPTGTYRLALWLPDSAETLRANPLYAVQLANENTWDEITGFNILSDKITIDANAPGATDNAATQFSVIP